MKQSETKTIKRSQISLNPYNPKNHTAEQVNMQKKNLRKVGFLGGIVWNELSTNLIDGHRRVQALDEINKYDGTPETDYEIKVEAVSFDDKTEKEQMSYMAIGNSKADFNLIAEYIDDIDYHYIGISEEEYKQIEMLKAIDDTEMDAFESIETMEDEFAPKAKKEESVTPKEYAPVTELPRLEVTNDEYVKAHAEKEKMSKDDVKAAKEHCKDVNTKYMDDTERYVILNFASMEEKQIFCDAIGMECKDNMIIEGADLINIMDL